jgi:hypothetical protein
MPLIPVREGRGYIIRDTAEEYDSSKHHAAWPSESLAWDDIFADEIARGIPADDRIREYYRTQYRVSDNWVWETGKKKPHVAESKEAAEKLKEELVEKHVKRIHRYVKTLEKEFKKTNTPFRGLAYKWTPV